jgi:thiol:disulfide interchange protein DsbA
VKKFLYLLLACLLPLSATAAGPEKYLEGTHYLLVTPAVPTADPKSIEVVELFWYGCSHCFHFEPVLAGWLKTKPADVKFRRIPAVFAQQWVPHARAMYAAEALGALDKLHKPLFEAIHADKRRIFDEESIMAFAGEAGFNLDEFRQAYDSPTVDGKAKMATMATRDYGIEGVPSVIVNGKYRITATLAGSQENILKVVDFLIAKERNAK